MTPYFALRVSRFIIPWESLRERRVHGERFSLGSLAISAFQTVWGLDGCAASFSERSICSVGQDLGSSPIRQHEHRRSPRQTIADLKDRQHTNKRLASPSVPMLILHIVTSVRRVLLLLLSFVCTPAFAQTPAVTEPLAARALVVGTGPTSIDLRPHFGLPGVTGTTLHVDTVMGRFNIELFDDTPLTKANFLQYTESGRYDNSIVHRSVANFVVQLGGYHARLPLEHIPTFSPVRNEYRRSNLRGTLAMAKLGNDPNSATSEWFINLSNNGANLDNQNGGFTVFGRVIGAGMDVVDSIARLQRFNLDNFTDFPLREVQPGQTSVLVSNFVIVNSVSTVPIFPAGGRSVISFTAQSSNSSAVTASIVNSTLVLTPVSNGTSTITVRAVDTNDRTAESTFAVSVATSISIAAEPQSQHVPPGASVTMSVTAQAASPLTYQWLVNGQPISGATNASYMLPGASANDMGFYAARLSSAGSSVTTSYASLTVNIPGGSRLVNVSTRGRAAAGEPLTPGFVIRGTGTKNLIVRAIGPSLEQFGVSGVVADPRMEVVPLGQSNVILTNDDWGSASAADVNALVTTSVTVGAFGLAAASKDAASLAALTVPGSSNGGYTVNITPVGNSAAGTTLAEIYDADPLTSPTRLINVSTLGAVTADGLTPGFVIGGTSPKLLLIRAVGPTLQTAFQVPGVLADPTLAIFPLGKDFTVASSNDWAENGRGPALEAAFTSAGAFSLPAGSRDAAVLVRLPPGAYTAVASGVGGATGRALVEVYDLDP
jgi:cyclophilin family peptidyl-prolyl cis-trans isomerase